MNPYGFNPYRYIVVGTKVQLGLEKFINKWVLVWTMCVPTIVSCIPFFLLKSLCTWVAAQYACSIVIRFSAGFLQHLASMHQECILHCYLQNCLRRSVDCFSKRHHSLFEVFDSLVLQLNMLKIMAAFATLITRFYARMNFKLNNRLESHVLTSVPLDFLVCLSFWGRL